MKKMEPSQFHLSLFHIPSPIKMNTSLPKI